MIDFVSKSFVTSDGFRIAYHEMGGAGLPPIILQHGYTTTSYHEWVECGIADKVRTLGRRLIAIDALGHGASDRPFDSRHYGEDRMARDVSELVTHIGAESFDLVGYSMGAVISLIVGATNARLRRLFVGGVGEGVVVCGGVDTRLFDNVKLAEVMQAKDTTGFDPFLLGFRSYAEDRGNHPLAMAAQALAVHSTPIALDRITAPTMLVAGDNDPLAASPKVLADAIPHCELVMVPGDHGGARESAEFSEALMRFLG